MRVEFKQREVADSLVLLRVAVSQRNLITMLVKLDDPTSARHIIGADVRICAEIEGAQGYTWAYEQTGWVMHLRGVERQDLHRSIVVSVDPVRRVVTLAVDKQGIRTLLGQVRDAATSPFDPSAPEVICETDDYHYGSRGLAPGIMAPQHEFKIQELGAMPGHAYPFGLVQDDEW